MARTTEETITLRGCPLSLCLPFCLSGCPTMGAAPRRFRTISNPLVILYPRFIMLLPSPRYLHTHPCPTAPLQHTPSSNTSPNHLLSTQTGQLAPSGPTWQVRTHPSNTTPIFRLRPTSARAQPPWTHGSASTPRTWSTTRWELALDWLGPIQPDLTIGTTRPGLTMDPTMDLTMHQLLAQRRSPSSQMAPSPCFSKEMTWRMRRPSPEREPEQ